VQDAEGNTIDSRQDSVFGGENHSFHDEYATFEEMIQYKDWDFCQIQLNYMDTEEQAGIKGYELAKITEGHLTTIYANPQALAKFATIMFLFHHF
jgi:hypothetical protein